MGKRRRQQTIVVDAKIHAIIHPSPALVKAVSKSLLDSERRRRRSSGALS